MPTTLPEPFRPSWAMLCRGEVVGFKGKGATLRGWNRHKMGRCLGIRVAHKGRGLEAPVSTFSHLRFPKGLAAARSRDCSQ